MKLVLHERASNHRRRWLIAYLGKTPVRWLAILLEHGCPYYRAAVTGIADLKTIFQVSKKNKQKKTLAMAAFRMIREKNHREKLLRYKAMLNGMLPADYGKSLDLVITAVHTKRGLIICDGNHRAIASYLVGKRELAIEYLDIRYPKERTRKCQRFKKNVA